MSQYNPSPITKDDVVTVEGRYLVKQSDGTRVLMKGLAFPPPPIVSESDSGYNAEGWLAVLQQIEDLGVEINTIRVYSMDPWVDYSEFLNKAAEMGIYVIVPLTGSIEGILDREDPAPKCYTKSLYLYGKACIDNYGKYPNVIGGLVSNEVMNSLETWKAAPCIAAYSRDLRLYASSTLRTRPFPLIYSAQNDGITPAVTASDSMKLTMDYLTCDEVARIDIFAINVESWCSSLESFQENEDDNEGSYHVLWRELHNSSIPIVFSEMGCALDDFDRENGLSHGARDWAQVPVVLYDMGDVWSGFCAYAYSGNPLFDMMSGAPWNGIDVLEPKTDFLNFQDQLHKANKKNIEIPTLPAPPRPVCKDAVDRVEEVCGYKLYDLKRMPSYYEREVAAGQMFRSLISLLVLSILVTICVQKRKRSIVHGEFQPLENSNGGTSGVKYKSINPN